MRDTLHASRRTSGLAHALARTHGGALDAALARALDAVLSEQRPDGQVKPRQSSVFGRLRDAFNH